MKANAHILVVEDEEHLATGIRYNLVAEGFKVTVVGDGPSALEAVNESPDGVDLIILDLMLPGMSGYAVCEALRAAGRDMPILILSARTLAEDRTRGFDLGADQYMTKPFDLDEFLSRVRSLLTLYDRRAERAAATPARAHTFEFANVSIDFEAYRVTLAGEPLRMTRLEFDLLRYFVENEGRVIPRAELLEKVWGIKGTTQTRAPDQFIRRLRKSLEAAPSQPRHFVTVRDIGYRFVANP